MKPLIRQKRKDGLKRQAEIMAVALELFSLKGFNATSVDDIIKAAGVAKGTFYLHFQGKGDILAMIIDSYLFKLYSSLQALDISMNRPTDELKRMYREVTDLLIDLPDIKQFIRLMLRDALSLDESQQKRTNDFFNRIVVMAAGYMRRAQEEGRVLTGLDPRICSLFMLGSVKEVLYRWAVQEEDLDVRMAIDTMVDLFFRGMLV